ncbi:hypothetical protein SAMN06265795_10826 [Noviherbaspirillum humi]|uniref:PXPV repeat-containing protein n=1 Tax=Noviherbaspirillum humi TaxID=1688639 RepID=A0A239HZG9_9BURK|nr:hypothetical protein [Noviherbaspirillum humi]SNS86599.1 hypothetical protein SAMN06265795_10826 [Noviherbaspirillum humi]
MKKRFAALLLGVPLLASLPGPTWAHGHRHGARVGVYVGPAYGWGWYPRPYYPYAYVYPPVAVLPATPPVYVEQAQTAPGAAGDVSSAPPGMQPGYWYYCGSPDGYYPYVKECSGGWRAVTPAPAQP